MKPAIANYMRDIGIPVTELLLPHDMDQITAEKQFFGKNVDKMYYEKLVMPYGQGKVDLFSFSDLGGVVDSVLSNAETKGKTYALSGDCLSGNEIAQVITKGIVSFPYKLTLLCSNWSQM